MTWLDEIEAENRRIRGKVPLDHMNERPEEKMTRVLREIVKYALKLEGIGLYYNPTVRHERDELSDDAKELLG